MNWQSENMKSVLQKPPSYLQDFLGDKWLTNIILVYVDKSCTNYSPKEKIEDNFTSAVASASAVLDVTGSPLKVDLNGDESLIIETSEDIHHWSESENKHFPMSISKARQYLNSVTDINMNNAIFVLCDGKDPVKTVLLGIQQTPKNLFSCTVNILGCFPKDDEHVTFHSMESSHYMLTGKRKCPIDYLVTFKYFVYGTFLQNIKKLHDSKYYGSVCIQTNTTSRCTINEPPKLVDKMKIILQVIIGHKKSLVNFLWEDLCLLQNYINIINIVDKTKVDPTIQICSEPLSEDRIRNSLEEIISSVLIKSVPKLEFDLNNIRQHNVLYKLWDVLKCCKDLTILRNAFHHLFECLVESNPNNKVSEGNNSQIATIINGIIDGKLAVPTINFTQALEFLFELGSETMKTTYQTITMQFYSVAAKDISTKWNQLQKKLEVEDNVRKMRLTQCLKSDKNNIEDYKMKLAYLGNLHVTVEIIYLVEQQAFLPKEAFNFLCKKVCENYLARESTTEEFKDLQDVPLCEFSLFMNISDGDIVKNESPDFYSVRMLTAVGNLKAETVYVFSKYSIIPLTIYDDYGVKDFGEDELPYYAYKLESHMETI